MKKARFIGALLAGVMAYTAVPAAAGMTEPFTVTAYAESKLPAPAGIKAERISPTGAVLVWDEVEGAGAYRIYKHSSSAGGYIEVGEVGSAFCAVKDLKPSTTYKFKIATLKKTDNGYEVQTLSSAVSVTTAHVAAPYTVSVTSGKSSVTLKWSKASGADAYRVYRYNSKTSKFVKYKDVKDTSCTVGGLTDGRIYKFRVASLVKSGDKYSVQGKSAVVAGMPQESVPFELPDMPEAGSGIADAVRKLGMKSLTCTDAADEGTMYTCTTVGSGYSQLILLYDTEDRLYASAYTALCGSASQVKELLEKRNGKCIVAENSGYDVLLWESKEGVKLAMFTDDLNGLAAGDTVTYAEISYKYCPEDMLDSFREWMNSAKSTLLGA